MTTLALSSSSNNGGDGGRGGLSSSGTLSGSAFATQVQHLARTLFRVIRDSAKMQEYRHDHERMCDYMYQVRFGSGAHASA